MSGGKVMNTLKVSMLCDGQLTELETWINYLDNIEIVLCKIMGVLDCVQAI